ncbi:hypothetical protein CDL12_04314 [Handroanthus impetiginosus]|uniref:DUF3444 domain-containing protein n=1 Tax=Handroanthus impetiginosus TaxID=429701 RepID=A0A2G9HZM6_9LAMI|nr:hypothetical protein CDL12_04314 [Handroanthus impetiginosus]
MGAQKNKDSSPSHAGSQGIASRKAVQPEPSFNTGSRSEGAAKVSGDLKTKETAVRNANSFHGGKEGGSSNGDTINRETRDRKNKSRKRARKVVESSESCDISSDSDLEDVTMDGNFDDLAADLKSGSSHVHFPRRSSRKRQNVSYKENDEDDIASSVKGAQATNEDNAKEQKDNVVTPDLKHGNHSSFPTDADHSKSEAEERGTVRSAESSRSKDAECDKGVKVREETGGKSGMGADTVEIESDSDQVSISRDDNPDIDLCHCPDPEFSDFDKERDENRFAINQFWACYDEFDGMPRFYAKVKKVRASPFELSITWLEAVPVNEDYEKWLGEGLPVGCGSFKLGKTEKTSARLSFSHQVHCERGKKRGSLMIYPREGEVWALFKNWASRWSSNPENHKEFKYELVEVLSDFVADMGIKVGYLEKVTGFVSLFQRAGQGAADSFIIGPNELYKFSHRVPSFKMTGSEREGVPIGSFELDPASLPLSPDDLYYPGKVKVESRNMDSGVHFSLHKSAERKGKTVVSEGTSRPR